MKCVGIYIRVSSREQADEGYSIPAQKRKLEAFCEIQGWESYRFYTDDGISAKDTDRPQLQALLQHIKDGEIDTLLVYKLDRFTRSVVDLYTMLQTLEDHGCAFRSATEPYDTSSAMGRMFIGIIALLAQWERENLSERVRMGKLEQVESGETITSNAPLGFKIVDKTFKIDPKTSPQVLEMLDKYEEGMSANAIARLSRTRADWNKLDTSDVLKVIKNPALIGYGHHHGKAYPLKDSEPLISEARYAKILELTKERSVKRNRSSEKPIVFKMKIKCPYCDAHLSGSNDKRLMKNGNMYTFYACFRCKREGRKKFSVSEQKIDKALVKYMNSPYVEHVQPAINKEPVQDRKKLRLELNNLTVQRERLTLAWSQGLIHDDEYKSAMNTTRVRFDELTETLAEEPILQTPVNIGPIIGKFRELWSLMDRQEKFEFCQKNIKTIHIRREEKNPELDKRGYPITVTYVEFYSF